MIGECAYLVGSDGTPWVSKTDIQDNLVTVTRNTRESGRLVTPWLVKGPGAIALSTATLVPREAPYHLTLELCRGTLGRILAQFGDRLLEEPSVRTPLQDAKLQFIQAALHQDDLERCTSHADRSLEICVETIRRTLCRVAKPSHSAPFFSSRLTGLQVDSLEQLSRLLAQTSHPGNAIFYQTTWRDTEPSPGEWEWQPWTTALERARAARRRVACGPLVRLDREALPDWLYLWDDDLDTLQSYVTTYVREAVHRLQSFVHLWYLAAGTNVSAELHLDEEQRLRLTIAALEELRKHDPQTPVLIGIRQPWGDYLGHTHQDLSPLQFADILVRTGLGLTGFVLELNLACQANRSMPRDLLEWNRLLDQWSSLGMPFVLKLTIPNDGAPATQPMAARQLMQDLMAILRQKTSVQGLIWGQFEDTHDWPSGVFTSEGKAKPMWRFLGDLWRPMDTSED